MGPRSRLTEFLKLTSIIIRHRVWDVARRPYRQEWHGWHGSFAEWRRDSQYRSRIVTVVPPVRAGYDHHMPSAALRKATRLLLSIGIKRQPLRLLTSEELCNLNELIRQGSVQRVDESVVKEPLEDALITDDHEEIYPVWNGVPVMQVFEVIEPRKLPIRFSAFDSPPSGPSQPEDETADGSKASRRTAHLDPN